MVLAWFMQWVHIAWGQAALLAPGPTDTQCQAAVLGALGPTDTQCQVTVLGVLGPTQYWGLLTQCWLNAAYRAGCSKPARASTGI